MVCWHSNVSPTFYRRDALLRMAAFWIPVAFCILYVCTILVNKYVLWVLGFTYPTLFQGWQTLVGFITLRFVASLGHIELSNTINRPALLQWLPAMGAFVFTIYSGSKALARLPVPIYVCLQGQVEVISGASIAFIFKQSPKPQVVCSWLIIMASSLTIWLTDPQYDQNGYKWMLLHIVVSSQSAIYSRWQKTYTLSEVDRLHYQYAFSVFVFAPASFLLGDLLSSSSFPHWYFNRFYVGCLMSGILGVSQALCYLYLRQTHADRVVSLTATTANIACAIVSVGVYLIVYDKHFVMSLFFGLAGQLINSVTKHDGIARQSHDRAVDEETPAVKLQKEQI